MLINYNKFACEEHGVGVLKHPGYNSEGAQESFTASSKYH